MIELKVTTPEGRYITGYGSRERGEVFDHLPDELALLLLEQQPEDFERVEPVKKKKQEVSDGG